MSSAIQTRTKQPRSSLPLFVLGIVVVAILVSMVIPLIDHVQYFYKYHTGPYLLEAMRAIRGEEQVAKWNDENTFREATIPLGNLMSLDFTTTTPTLRAEVRNDRFWVGSKLVPKVVESDKVFKAWDRYLVDQIYALTKSRTPVWMPAEYRRGARLDTRACYWLLADEFRAALSEKDSTRALKALEACDWLVKSNDLDYPVYRAGGGTELRRRLCQLICDSMAAEGVWNNEQLNDLRTRFLQPTDYTKRSRAFLLESYASAVENSSIFTAPDPRHSYTPESIYGDLQKLDKNGFQYSAYDNFTVPELWRRLAILGIAAKQFNLAKHSWPKDLTELQQFGVAQEIWSGPFLGRIYWLPTNLQELLSEHLIGEEFDPEALEQTFRIELRFIDTNKNASNKEIVGFVEVK